MTTDPLEVDIDRLVREAVERLPTKIQTDRARYLFCEAYFARQEVLENLRTGKLPRGTRYVRRLIKTVAEHIREAVAGMDLPPWSDPVWDEKLAGIE